MSETSHLQDDLRFVRETVARRDRDPHRPNAIYWSWAAYVLIGYTMIDLAPRASGWFFMIGGFAGGAFSAWIGRRHSERIGELDRHRRRAIGWHFGGGVVLSMICAFGLAWAIPELRNNKAGQIVVELIGMVYFLAGVHIDRNFLWIGPILMIGGVFVGFVPHHGWTCLGAIIALALVIPTLVPSKRLTQQTSAVSEGGQS